MQDDSHQGKELPYEDYLRLYYLIKDSLRMGDIINKPTGYNKGYFLKTLGIRIAFYRDNKTLTIDSKYSSVRDSSTFNKYILNDLELDLLTLEIYNFLMDC